MAVLRSGLPDVVDDKEDLARFLPSRSLFNSLMAKPAAFMPYKGETSVFRHGAEPRAELWQIAKDHALGDRTLHGAAIVRAQHVRGAGLDVVASEPPPRHASIIGWVSRPSNPDMEKADRLKQATLIAQQATLVRP